MSDSPSHEDLVRRIRELEQTLVERDRTQASLKRRIRALTLPPDDPGDIRMEDLFDIDDIQRLQDHFASATSVASIITRTDGTAITRPSNFCRLCESVIRRTKKGLQDCHRSHVMLGPLSPDGPVVRQCASGGLWDAGAGISVGGRQIASWLIGQVRDDTRTEAGMRAYAREIGADEAAMVEAFNKVPAMPVEQFRRVAQMLFVLANQLSEMAYQNLAQVRSSAGRQRAEAALKESEDRLRVLIRTLPDLVWLKDRDGVYLLCNSRIETLFDAREAEIIGKTDYDFVDRDLADFLRKHDRLAMDEGRPCKNEETLVFASDGHRETLETIRTPMYRRDGTLAGVLGIGRDITDRITAEKQLAQSQSRYRRLYREAAQRRELYESLLNSTPDALVIYNLDGEAQYVNPAFTRIFGYTLEDVVGKRIPFVPEAEAEPSMAGIRKVLGGEPISNMATRRLTKDGRILDVALSSSCYDDHAGNRAGIVVFLRDVTGVKETEAQLRQAQKMESVGRLAGGVAHDFNNMLSVISGYAEMALGDMDDTHPLVDSLREIRKAANRSADLTRQLLAFARKQTIAPKVIDLNRVLEGLLRMLQRLLGEDIELVWRPAAELWPVRVDTSQIDQLLTNLCVNARDAIRDVGRIIIETGTIHIDEIYCREHRGFVPGDFVMLAVSDDGTGMDKETLEKIFDPFFTTKGDLRGTGLGLSTVYGVVKQNAGFINVYSEPGQGTTFKIYLPRHAGLQADGVDEPVETIPRGSGEVVLVVEDEPLILKLTEKMLLNLGYRVLTAGTPTEALALAQSHTGDIALVLTDVVMPGLNGRELVERMKALYPGIKCLYMSGYTANVIAHRGVLEAGVDFIQKPFAKKDLAIRVRAAMETS